MAHPDYEQHHYHHGCLLILVRGIGPLKPRSLQRVFERIQRINNVKIPGKYEEGMGVSKRGVDHRENLLDEFHWARSIREIRVA